MAMRFKFIRELPIRQSQTLCPRSLELNLEETLDIGLLDLPSVSTGSPGSINAESFTS
jgi:hypothetical protein